MLLLDDRPMFECSLNVLASNSAQLRVKEGGVK